MLGRTHCHWVATVNARAQGHGIIFCPPSTLLQSPCGSEAPDAHGSPFPWLCWQPCTQCPPAEMRNETQTASPLPCPPFLLESTVFFL